MILIITSCSFGFVFLIIIFFLIFHLPIYRGPLFYPLVVPQEDAATQFKDHYLHYNISYNYSLRINRA